MTSLALTPAQRDRDIGRLQDAIHALERAPVVRPCVQCLHFRPDTGHCDIWNAIVPEPARADGCLSWEEGVPF
ncbi:MAG: hypothetical protein OZ919_11615 [Xanthomonadaceae bacterium]|nr:hypothetical protein [Xanthomonadaceae bacterium]